MFNVEKGFLWSLLSSEQVKTVINKKHVG